MHGAKSGVEIKGNIEIVLLILILVIAAVGALYYYAQKEPQRANQEMPLVTPTPPPSVNKAATPLKTVKPSARRQETKIALQEKKKPATESAVPAVKKTNQEAPLTTPTPPPPENKATTAPLKTVKPPAPRQETKIALQEKTNPAAESAVPAVKKTDNGGLASEQKTAKPLQKNTATVAESDKTISGSLYSIRVGSFRSKENVDRLFKKLKENGYQPSLEIVILSDNSTWYRITAGPFKTQEEATRCAKNLEDKEKIKTMIVKMK